MNCLRLDIKHEISGPTKETKQAKEYPLIQDECLEMPALTKMIKRKKVKKTSSRKEAEDISKEGAKIVKTKKMIEKTSSRSTSKKIKSKVKETPSESDIRKLKTRRSLSPMRKTRKMTKKI